MQVIYLLFKNNLLTLINYMQIIYLFICYLFIIIHFCFLFHLRMLKYASTRTLATHVVGTLHYTCTDAVISLVLYWYSRTLLVRTASCQAPFGLVNCSDYQKS